MLSTTLLYFHQNDSNLKSIEQKLSTPGHSLIQELDCVQSVIDKNLKNLEIFSPLSLLRYLKNISHKNVTLKLIQMQPLDFYAYSNKSCNLNFSQIRFTKIKFLKYEGSDLFTLQFKTSGRDLAYKTTTLIKKPSKNNLATPKNLLS